MPMNMERIINALSELRFTDWDYYDGNNVWCRFCRQTRPSPEHDGVWTWHDPDCIWRIANEEFLSNSGDTERPLIPPTRFKRIPPQR